MSVAMTEDLWADALQGEYSAAADAPGIYARLDPVDHGLDVYRVRRSKSSGRLYATILDPTTAQFDYAKGAIFNLRVADRLTDTLAAYLGQAYGFCIVCGAELTDPTSVARGIGPVCAKRV